jgi:hypothetical protein
VDELSPEELAKRKELKAKFADRYLERLIREDPELSEELPHLLDVKKGMIENGKIRFEKEPGEIERLNGDKKAIAVYDPNTQEIIFSEKALSVHHTELASALGHELQHHYDATQGPTKEASTIPSEQRAALVEQALYKASLKRVEGYRRIDEARGPDALAETYKRHLKNYIELARKGALEMHVEDEYAGAAKDYERDLAKLESRQFALGDEIKGRSKAIEAEPDAAARTRLEEERRNLLEEFRANDVRSGELRTELRTELEILNEPPKELSPRARELWDRVIAEDDPKSTGQLYHGDFHGAEVAENLQRWIDQARASGEIVPPRMELLLRTASRWHDIDPTRPPDAPPSVERTIEWMKNSADAQAFLKEAGLSHDEVAAMIRATDFHPDPLVRAKQWDRFMLSAIDAFPPGQAGEAIKWGSRMAASDQSSTYFLDPELAQERVRGLARELKAPEDALLKGTPKFMAELERSFGFESLKKAGLLTEDQLRAFETNKREFGKLAEPASSRVALNTPFTRSALGSIRKT